MDIPLLTTGESKVYQALVELGSSTIGNIISHSKVSHSKIYDILKRLESKGLVSRITKQGRMVFEAAPPSRLTSLVKEQQQTLEEHKQTLQTLIPELEGRKENLPSAHIFRSFEGIKGMQAVLDEVLGSLKKGDEVCILGTPKRIVMESGGFLKEWQQQRIEKKIPCKILADPDAPSWKEDWWAKSKKDKLTLTKRGQAPAPSFLVITKDRVATIYYAGAILSVLIHHPDIAKRYQSMFKQLWA
ncbi:MAG: helix-turn-helix domain-containing protein [Candidatus Woesearchaeota archaeon]|jgi:sugar-specific transcriptional regulator TrmB|nr:helix-turn-helix domain-containing protein [Candidatus Woesearchaeota archaeon]MDP7181499.1 helix-turn-helix domain-containing protein [Candidatus Woesearchaeota archaeon]MDP7198541.1 helix-turn-helix domain-containing protein [Candidatus Woesearchaeota archaeon]MDP7466717.1 helix-turn-helix domain-containing protein [Candidatus Woesearchaeota archaeon]MDP7647180.1 helix-turn-helix domain-containing protein [Candidatus Woesearchaeota archaeon]